MWWVWRAVGSAWSVAWDQGAASNARLSKATVTTPPWLLGHLDNLDSCCSWGGTWGGGVMLGLLGRYSLQNHLGKLTRKHTSASAVPTTTGVFWVLYAIYSGQWAVRSGQYAVGGTYRHQLTHIIAFPSIFPASISLWKHQPPLYLLLIRQLACLLVSQENNFLLSIIFSSTPSLLSQFSAHRLCVCVYVCVCLAAPVIIIEHINHIAFTSAPRIRISLAYLDSNQRLRCNRE